MATEGFGSARAPAGVAPSADRPQQSQGRPVVWLGALDDDRALPRAVGRCHGCAFLVARRPAHRRGARREDARADSNLGFQTSAMSGESARLRANAEEQVTRLLTQLSDLEEYRDELDDDEYEEMRADTLTQLEEFKASLARMVAGDVTLLNELESIRVRPFPASDSGLRTRPRRASPAASRSVVPNQIIPGGHRVPVPGPRVCPLTEPLVQFSRALCSSRRRRRCPRRFERVGVDFQLTAEAARAASRATGDGSPATDDWAKSPSRPRKSKAGGDPHRAQKTRR